MRLPRPKQIRGIGEYGSAKTSRSYMAFGLALRTRVAVRSLVAFRRTVVMVMVIMVVTQDMSGGHQWNCNGLQTTLGCDTVHATVRHRHQCVSANSDKLWKGGFHKLTGNRQPVVRSQSSMMDVQNLTSATKIKVSVGRAMLATMSRKSVTHLSLSCDGALQNSWSLYSIGI